MNKRCHDCKRFVIISASDFEYWCLGVDKMIYCKECKDREDDLLRREGLGDCTLKIKSFPRL